MLLKFDVDLIIKFKISIISVQKNESMLLQIMFASKSAT